jgi:hypothetical protein
MEQLTATFFQRQPSLPSHLGNLDARFAVMRSSSLLSPQHEQRARKGGHRHRRREWFHPFSPLQVQSGFANGNQALALNLSDFCNQKDVMLLLVIYSSLQKLKHSRKRAEQPRSYSRKRM